MQGRSGLPVLYCTFLLEKYYQPAMANYWQPSFPFVLQESQMLREHARQERLAKELQARADREDSKENARSTPGFKEQSYPCSARENAAPTQGFKEQQQPLFSKENADFTQTLGFKGQQAPLFRNPQPFLEQCQNEQGSVFGTSGKLGVVEHLAEQELLQHEMVDGDCNLHRLGAAVLAFTSWE